MLFSFIHVSFITFRDRQRNCLFRKKEMFVGSVSSWLKTKAKWRKIAFENGDNWKLWDVESLNIDLKASKWFQNLSNAIEASSFITIYIWNLVSRHFHSFTHSTTKTSQNVINFFFLLFYFLHASCELSPITKYYFRKCKSNEKNRSK